MTKTESVVKNALLNGKDFQTKRGWIIKISNDDKVQIWPPTGEGRETTLAFLDKAVSDFCRQADVMAPGVNQTNPPKSTSDGSLGKDTSGKSPKKFDPSVNKQPNPDGSFTDKSLGTDTSTDEGFATPSINKDMTPDDEGLTDTDLGSDSSGNSTKFDNKVVNVQSDGRTGKIQDTFANGPDPSEIYRKLNAKKVSKELLAGILNEEEWEATQRLAQMDKMSPKRGPHMPGKGKATYSEGDAGGQIGAEEEIEAGCHGSPKSDKKSTKTAGPKLREKWLNDGGYHREIESESAEELHALVQGFSGEDVDWAKFKPAMPDEKEAEEVQQQPVQEGAGAAPITAKKGQQKKTHAPEILANVGDINFIDYGGLIVVDTGYGPEGWYIRPPDANPHLEYQEWELYRFPLDKVVDDSAWFMKKLESIADTIGSTEEELRGWFASDDLTERALGYDAVIGWGGADEFDDPQQLDAKEIHELFGEDYIEDAPEERGSAGEEVEEDEFGSWKARKAQSADVEAIDEDAKDTINNYMGEYGKELTKDDGVAPKGKNPKKMLDKGKKAQSADFDLHRVLYAVESGGDTRFRVKPIWRDEALATLEDEETGERTRVPIGDLREFYTLLDSNENVVSSPDDYESGDADAKYAKNAVKSKKAQAAPPTAPAPAPAAPGGPGAAPAPGGQAPAPGAPAPKAPAPKAPQGLQPGVGDAGIQALGWTAEDVQGMTDEQKKGILQIKLTKPGTQPKQQMPEKSPAPKTPAPAGPQAPGGPSSGPAAPGSEPAPPAPSAPSPKAVKGAKKVRKAQAAPLPQTEEAPAAPDMDAPQSPAAPPKAPATPAAPKGPAKPAGQPAQDPGQAGGGQEQQAFQILQEVQQAQVNAATPNEVGTAKVSMLLQRLLTELGITPDEASKLFGLQRGNFGTLFK